MAEAAVAAAIDRELQRRRCYVVNAVPPHIGARLAMVDGCLIWTGGVNRQGYGRCIDQARQWLAHRLVFTFAVRPLADGEILHHREGCPKRCVDPDHLTPTTRSEHPDSRPAQLAARTHCEYGHPLDGRRGNGFRYCLTCNRDRVARYAEMRR